MTDRAWLVAHTDQMKSAYRERVEAGWEPKKERRDLKVAILDRAKETGMSEKEAQRFVREQL